MTEKQFSAGRNIAMKLPATVYDETIAFYQDVLGFTLERLDAATARTRFGGCRLWFDRVSELERGEVWLEISVEDYRAAADHLLAHGVAGDATIEPLAEDFRGFWIRNPAGLVHLVAEPGQDG